MGFDDYQQSSITGFDDEELSLESRRGRSPGKRTLTLGLSQSQAPIQAHGAGAEEHGKTANFATAGTGRPMPKAIQSEWNSAFKTDFSDVRVHESSPAPKQVGATAFTQGNDIHFAPGTYNPGSSAGKELIGHELTHVVQQRAGRVGVQAKGGTINADASLESEADQLGARAARGEQVDVQGVGSGIQRDVTAPPKVSPAQLATSIIGQLMTAKAGQAATEAAAQAAKVGVEQKLAAKVKAAAETSANAAATSLIQAATDAKTGMLFTTQHGDGTFTAATGQAAQQEVGAMQGDGFSDASSQEMGNIAQAAAQASGQAAATQSATARASATATAVAQTQLDETEARVAAAMMDAARTQIGAVRAAVEARTARDAETLISPTPSQAPAGLGDLNPGIRARIEAALVARAVSAAVADASFMKAAAKFADTQKKSVISATQDSVSENMQGQQGAVRQDAIVAARQGAHDSIEEIRRESEEDDTKAAIDTFAAELAESLNGHVAGMLNASRFHQWGRKRELREQLKAVARTVVNTEIQAQMPQGQEREGQQDQLKYKETLARREAYGEIKQDVGAFLTEVATGIAGRAAKDQKMAMSARAVEAAKSGASPMAALQSARKTLLSNAQAQADRWVEQLYAAMEGGATAVEAAQEASGTDADVGQNVRDRGVAQTAIESASSEEGIGTVGKLLDKIIPDPGDGVSLNIALKIPIATDPFGGFAAKLNLLVGLTGKAGRGTEGFVTAGVPAIASNPKHLELELAYSIGLGLEAGDASTLGFDISASYESFVRAGADSTESALAAFRYAVYRGTPVKALAGAWYGGRKQGRGPQGTDYLLAEQRAAAVEEQHFMADGKQRTFADHGRGLGVAASGSAKAPGSALGAKGKVEGHAKHFRHTDGSTLAKNRIASPDTQDQALSRRREMNRGTGSEGKGAFSLAGETEVSFGGQAITVSAAFSGGSPTNWGIEIKAGLTGNLATGGPMDFIVVLASAMYELEHKLLSAAGNHYDREEEFRNKGMSKADMKAKLSSRLLKRAAAQTAVGVGVGVASALGLATTGIAASFQFGLSGGTWTDRFDLISSMKIATPESLPIFSADLTKETRLISAEHQGLQRAAFSSPGVLAENQETE